MPNIKFIQFDGSERSIDVKSGFSLMEGAIWQDIDGIEAQCGGALSCATCHVIVDPRWADRLTPASDGENDMLSGIEGRQPTSRLSCQIKVTDDLEGLVVTVPEHQS